MRLQGRHILVDGYNLELPRGTGIKSYTLTLIRALRGLGARVSVLWSCRRSKVPVVQDALWAEERRGGSSVTSAVGALRALTGLAARATDHVPTGWVIPVQNDHSVVGLLEKCYFLPNCFRLASSLYGHMGRTLRARVRDRVDVWHTTCPLPISVRGTKRVTTIPDLIPLKLPWATLDNKRYFYRVVQQALARSDLVLTISECAKRDITDIYGVRPEAIEVVYPPVDYEPAAPPEELLARQLRVYGLRPQSYILFVGAIQPRKNLGRLCQALSYLDCDTPLVVVGSKGWLWKQELQYARPLLRKRRAFFLDHVPRAHLPALYGGAIFFAFPSLYEGFGLPPLEAMAHDCPVLASHTSCLPEVCGDAAVYVDPYDVADIAEKIRTLLQDDRLRQRLREKGRERLERYSMANYQRRLSETYGQMLA